MSCDAKILPALRASVRFAVLFDAYDAPAPMPSDSARATVSASRSAPSAAITVMSVGEKSSAAGPTIASVTFRVRLIAALPTPATSAVALNPVPSASSCGADAATTRMSPR